MRFNLGEVWQSKQGRRAAVVAIEDDGHRGKLHFEDTADEEWQNWAGLTAPGQWHLDASPRPTRTGDELKAMVLQRIQRHPVCPQGMSVEIESTQGGNWKALSVPPPNQHIAFADCAHHIGYVARVLGLLYGLAGAGTWPIAPPKRESEKGGY